MKNGLNYLRNTILELEFHLTGLMKMLNNIDLIQLKLKMA